MIFLSGTGYMKIAASKGVGGGGARNAVSVGVLASPVPEPSTRCCQGHDGSRRRVGVVGNAWGGGGVRQGGNIHGVRVR